MPSKQFKPNGFLLFVQETRCSDPQYANKTLDEMITIANPIWKNLPEDQKDVYKQRAKGNRTPSTGAKDPGRPGPQTGDNKWQDNVAHETALTKTTEERARIEAKVKSWSQLNIISKYKIFVMDVKVWCELTEGRVLPGEISIVEFSLEQGILRCFHQLIDPGKIPIGYTATILKRVDDKFKIPLEHHMLCKDYADIIRHIVDFVGYQKQDLNLLNPIHVVNRTACKEGLNWLCDQAGFDADHFVLHDFHFFFHLLLKYSKLCVSKKPPTEDFLKGMVEHSTKWLFTPGLSCRAHYEADVETDDCALGYARRLSYHLLEQCKEYYKMTPVMWRHFPDLNPEQLSEEVKLGITTPVESVQPQASARLEGMRRGATPTMFGNMSMRTEDSDLDPTGLYSPSVSMIDLSASTRELTLDTEESFETVQP